MHRKQLNREADFAEDAGKSAGRKMKQKTNLVAMGRVLNRKNDDAAASTSANATNTSVYSNMMATADKSSTAASTTSLDTETEAPIEEKPS